MSLTILPAKRKDASIVVKCAQCKVLIMELTESEFAWGDGPSRVFSAACKHVEETGHADLITVTTMSF